MVVVPRRLRAGLVHGRHGRAVRHASLRRATSELTLRIMPPSRDEVPMLGRIKLIHDAIAEQRVLDSAGRHAARQPQAARQRGVRLVLGGGQVSRFASALPRPISQTSQATCTTRIQRPLPPDVSRTIGPTSSRVAGVRRDARPRLRLRAHGDRLPAAASRWPDERTQSTIAADRGWQSSGVRLEAGKSYRRHAPAGIRSLRNRQRRRSPGPASRAA